MNDRMRMYYSDEARALARRKNFTAIAQALIAGLAVGVAGGLLANPKNRKKLGKAAEATTSDMLTKAEKESKGLRRMVKKQAKMSRKKAMELFDDTEDEAKNLADFVRRRFA